MRNQGQIIFGTVVLVIGLLCLAGTLFDIDPGILCFPTVLILAGVLLLLRPWMVRPDTGLNLAFFGPVRRYGTWQVKEEEIWLVVGDVNLDVTEAEVPPGETRIRIFSFVSTIRLIVPEGVGVEVAPTAFLTEARLFGAKRDLFLTAAPLTSGDYESAERKIRLEPTMFVADVKVRRPAAD